MAVCLTAGSVPHLNGESVEVVEHDVVRLWEQRGVTLERAKKRKEKKTMSLLWL